MHDFRARTGSWRRPARASNLVKIKQIYLQPEHTQLPSRAARTFDNLLLLLLLCCRLPAGERPKLAMLLQATCSRLALASSSLLLLLEALLSLANKDIKIIMSARREFCRYYMHKNGHEQMSSSSRS